MYFKSLIQPTITSRSVYTEVFQADGYVYLNYEDNANIHDGLIPVSETEWIEKKPVIPEIEPVIEPTQEEIQAAMLLNQTDMLINQVHQDEVLAEILLNTLGV